MEKKPKQTMQQCLKTNGAKTEQDAPTTTGGSHCRNVCRSHRSSYDTSVFLSHQLQKIICFRGKQEGETERYSPDGRRSQRALFAQNGRDTPAEGAGRVHWLT